MPATRVLVWATTFGADLGSFARFLDARDDIELLVALDDEAAWRRQPIARLFPLRARLIPRRGVRAALSQRRFAPQVTVLDNNVPRHAVSPAGFVLWHGLGWKGPNDRVEFAPLHAALRRAWGDPCADNPRFRWQCFGPEDERHRTEVSGFHPSNTRQIGACSHDELRTPLERGRVAADYPFDIVRRKTVLVAPTWHYGEVLAHWGADGELLDRLFSRIAELGANALLRLHDRFRYPPEYAELLSRLAREHRVLLRFKDEAPENYIDLQVADVLVTNYSSIANLFYATGRPTIHVYPVRDADEAFLWRRFQGGRLVTQSVSSARFVWKLSPEEHGGLLARDFASLLAQVERALAEPDCCRLAARGFVDRYMLGADGQARERALDVVRELSARRSP